MSDSASRQRSNTVIGPAKSAEISSLSSNPSNQLKMAESISTTSLSLPQGQKLKGRENYTVWKENILVLAASHRIDYHLVPSKRYPKPQDLSNDDDWEDASTEQQTQWENWVAMDAKALMAIRNNILSGPLDAIQGKKTAIDVWNTLQITYEGKGGMLVYHALNDITRLQCENTAKTDEYINTFRKLLSQLSYLKAPLSDIHAVILFVIGAKKTYPTWADSHCADTINKIDESNLATRAVLDTLIEDLLDASKAKKPNDNSNTSKPTGGALAAQNKGGKKGGNKGGKKGKGKGSKCNNIMQ